MSARVRTLLGLSLGLGLSLSLAAQTPDDVHRPVVERLVVEALKSEDAYRGLGELCDQVGHRLSGSPGYDKAVAWSLARMKAYGLKNVRAEKVMVPVWRRNSESALLLEPARHELSMLGLGGSVPTPKGGITAEVVVVGSFDELEKLPEAQVKGRIVCFDVPFTGYGATARYRVQGASAAAKKGGVAALVRSLAPVSLDTPHTGVMHYDENAPRIPTAAISVENATMLHRMARRGDPMKLHLEMNCETLPDAPAANVIGELPGREHPEEVVVVGGHLDSWDVGQGAQDDGVGCILSLEAVHLIQRLGLQPKRTLRVVFFANEENGNRGGLGYLEAHRQELSKHVAAFESDIGNGLIKGFGLELHKRSPEDAARALALLQHLKPYLEPLGAGQLETTDHGGVDVGPMVREGVPGLGVNHDTTRYWDVHHSKADTFDKVNKEDLAKNLAILSVACYLVADGSERF